MNVLSCISCQRGAVWRGGGQGWMMLEALHRYTAGSWCIQLCFCPSWWPAAELSGPSWCWFLAPVKVHKKVNFIRINLKITVHHFSIRHGQCIPNYSRLKIVRWAIKLQIKRACRRRGVQSLLIFLQLCCMFLSLLWKCMNLCWVTVLFCLALRPW